MQFAADGCIKPNIHTTPYRVTLTAPCEHTKLRSVEIILDAESDEAARQFAETWLRQGPMRQLQVTAVEPTVA